MPEQVLRDFLYLDPERLLSLASQLEFPNTSAATDRAARERLYLELEPALLARPNAALVDSTFDFARWTPDAFADGQFVKATGVVRLLDFAWLTQALGGLPAVLRKMSKLEMEALKNSDEGRKMSKQQIQQRQNENQVAITKVEEFKADELGEVVSKLYGDVVRVKIRPSKDHPQFALIGSANSKHFYDSPAALSQKFGIEIPTSASVVAAWSVGVPARTAARMPSGIAMNNAFRIANAPAFPALSFTPIAIYRTVR